MGNTISSEEEATAEFPESKLISRTISSIEGREYEEGTDASFMNGESGNIASTLKRQAAAAPTSILNNEFDCPTAMTDMAHDGDDEASIEQRRFGRRRFIAPIPSSSVDLYGESIYLLDDAIENESESQQEPNWENEAPRDAPYEGVSSRRCDTIGKKQAELSDVVVVPATDAVQWKYYETTGPSLDEANDETLPVPLVRNSDDAQGNERRVLTVVIGSDVLENRGTVVSIVSPSTVVTQPATDDGQSPCVHLSSKSPLSTPSPRSPVESSALPGQNLRSPSQIHDLYSQETPNERPRDRLYSNDSGIVLEKRRSEKQVHEISPSKSSSRSIDDQRDTLNTTCKEGSHIRNEMEKSSKSFVYPRQITLDEDLRESDGEAVNMELVRNYQTAFYEFLSLYPHFADDPGIETLLVLKLQKLFAQVGQVETDLQLRSDLLAAQKEAMSKHFHTMLIKATKIKAARRVELQRSLHNVQARTSDSKRLARHTLLSELRYRSKKIESFNNDREPGRTTQHLTMVPEILAQTLKTALGQGEEISEDAAAQLVLDAALLRAESSVLEKKLQQIRETMKSFGSTVGTNTE